MFAGKLKRLMEMLKVTVLELSEETGIPVGRVQALLAGNDDPSGSEVLIFADYFYADFNYFISDDKSSALESAETLFRKNDGQLTKSDMRRISEFLFLCECEAFLQEVLDRPERKNAFSLPGFEGGTHKKQGASAAAAVRAHLGAEPDEPRLDLIEDFRALGIHVFLRDLGDSPISGVYMKHRKAGKRVLANSSQDPYRRRFTLAHEACHAIFDDHEDSEIMWESDPESSGGKADLIEVRANSFASNYLVPSGFLRMIPQNKTWYEIKIKKYSSELRVNPVTLVIALDRYKLIDENTKKLLKNIKLDFKERINNEIPDYLTELEGKRVKILFEKGLSPYYVDLCLEAFERDFISSGRLAEMLLADEHSLIEIASLHRKHV
jgi:Zn-dependent peptidase ImmA (M78 family)